MARKDGLYNAAQIRDALTQYINQNFELVDSRNPRSSEFDALLIFRNIKIDYNLATLLKPEESNVVFLPRDKVLDRLLASSSPYYRITTEQETQTRYTFFTSHLIGRKGKPPKIHVILEKRQGRKTVTRFWGLEAFFIKPNELAEELRNTCATSASVGGKLAIHTVLILAMHTSTPKQPLMEVLIQGPQTPAVIDALEKRGVKKAFIVVEDKRK
jgi:translation initiation factor 2D